ncbi:MAG: nucleotide sugar dehydrogenase [Eubacteriales bacterium]|nr:nucleotide sugar dehydrogenase [Eubacteriales bacterium]MDD4584048.1 nucleotide sugar dehydrogenase [Eubacteriales bacterium]
MKICVIGLGYIGLPTAAMFAASGNQVVGVDRNPKIVEALNQGKITIEEKGLDRLVRQVVEDGALCGSSVPEEADAFIIAVPTPITADKKADMSYVIASTENIVPYLKAGDIIVLESTSPVGTVDQLMIPILETSGLHIGEELYVGHSPERVIPGQILQELVNNSRIAGGINPVSAEKIALLYKSFVKGEIYLTDTRTAELCKLAENTYRDVNIAFANELAKICENMDVNVWEAIALCNKHPRVNIHQPGPGVGGHCIAVDPWFIVEKQPKTAQIINLSRYTNDSMPFHVASRILNILTGIPNPQVTILGVTYKPNVDDMRESPILHLIEILKKEGISVNAFDPYVKNNEGISNDLQEAVTGSDLLILGVHHDQFKNLPFAELGKLMDHKNFLDTRNFISTEDAKAAGFHCYLLGSK